MYIRDITKRKCTALIILLLCTFSLHAEKISVVTEYLPPYQLKNDDGSLGGFSTDIIKALFTLTGDQADITVLPWARAYNQAKHKKNTLIYSIAHTKNRDPYFNWIGCMKTVRLYVWGLKAKFPTTLHSIDDLNQYAIAVTRNSSAGQYINALVNSDKIYPVVHEDQAMKMLYRNRVDIIVGAEILFTHRAKKLNLNFSKMKKLFEIKALNVDLCVAFNKETDHRIIERYTKAFAKLKTSGVLEQIKNKWQITE